MDVTHSPVCKEVLMVSGVSILKVSDFRYLFSELRSIIGLHLLLGLVTKKSQRCLICDLFYCILLNKCM